MTTLLETFNTTDSDTLGPTQTWVEDSGDIDILSNKARLVSTAVARISTSLSSDNHYAQANVDVGDDAAANNAYGVMVRKVASATATFYLCDLFFNANFVRLHRYVGGSVTAVAADVSTTLNASTQYLVKLSCIGSTLITSVDGVQKHSTTDTNIIGNLQVGLRGDGPLGLGNWDDFEAADIPSVSHRASIAGTGNTTTSVTLVIPASTVVNDVVYASFVNGAATADPSVADNEGAGTWTKLLSGNNGTSNLSVWWKRASANTASKTITASGFTGSCVGVASVYSGAVLTGNPYGGQTYESNISGNETHAEITPTVNGSMVCLTVGQAPDIAIATQAATSPAVLIERAEHLSTGGADSSVAHASEVQVTAGATGALTWAQTNAATMSIAFYIPPDVDANTTRTGAIGSGFFAGIASRMDLGMSVPTEVNVQ